MVRIMENSDKWIKFFSTKKHYYNINTVHCTIIKLKSKIF
jgi:hypothetical protein